MIVVVVRKVSKKRKKEGEREMGGESQKGKRGDLLGENNSTSRYKWLQAHTKKKKKKKTVEEREEGIEKRPQGSMKERAFQPGEKTGMAGALEIWITRMTLHKDTCTKYHRGVRDQKQLLSGPRG